jgi:phosphatidylinositol alpha-1,6-mannosyltransferase
MTEAFGALGGIQQFNRDWVVALAKLDFVEYIEILVRQQSAADEIPERVSQHCPNFGKAGYVATALSKATELSADDIILCGHIHLTPLAAVMARIAGARIWLHLHGVEAWSRPGPLIRQSLSSMSLISIVSRFTRSRFLGWSTSSPHLVKVLPNAIGDEFSPEEAPTDLKARMGLSGRKVLLTVGRLASNEAYKGQDRVMRALPEILEKVPNVVYLLAGDGDHRPRLESLARKLSIEQHVRFLGTVEGGDLVSLYRAADLFVMPSEGEGFGIVFLEAMACGCRALGLNVGGSVDALSGSPLGHTCGTDELPGVIIEFLNSPQRALDINTNIFSRESFNGYVADMTQALAGSAN